MISPSGSTNNHNSNFGWMGSFANGSGFSKLLHRLRNKKIAFASTLALIGASGSVWAWQAATSTAGPSPRSNGFQSNFANNGGSFQAPAKTNSADGSSSIKVKVNGESIEIPTTGSLHKTITKNGTTTKIDIERSADSSSQHSSQSISVVSNSSSSVSSNVSVSSNGGSE